MGLQVYIGLGLDLFVSWEGVRPPEITAPFSMFAFRTLQRHGPPRDPNTQYRGHAAGGWFLVLFRAMGCRTSYIKLRKAT